MGAAGTTRHDASREALRREAREGRVHYFWYRIGRAHPMGILAVDEDAARAAILARHPHARGQRITISLFALD